MFTLRKEKEQLNKALAHQRELNKSVNEKFASFHVLIKRLEAEKKQAEGLYEKEKDALIQLDQEFQKVLEDTHMLRAKMSDMEQMSRQAKESEGFAQEKADLA